MVSGPLTDVCYDPPENDVVSMLIVCPSCATSYMIDPATLGQTGRTVRCARCKATWFAGGQSNVTPVASTPKPMTKGKTEMSAFVNGVIAEAEAAQPLNQRPSEPSADASEPESVAPAPEPKIPRAEPLVAASAADEAPHTIEDAPPLVPPIEHPEAHETSAAHDGEEVESFAARRERLHARRKRARRSSRWTAIVLVLFAFNVALVGARNEVVRFLPQTASLFAAIGLPVNLRHLNFEKVRIIKESANGGPVLVVEGSIISAASQPVEVPKLRFAVRNKDGQEIYTWTMPPSRGVLKPGERLDFTSRLTSPPKDAHDVMVRFFTASDAMAGAK